MRPVLQAIHGVCSRIGNSSATEVGPIEKTKRWSVEGNNPSRVYDATCQRPPLITRLTSEEQSIYDDLRHNRLGNHIRLEQENIAFTTRLDALEKLESPPFPEPHVT